MDHSRDSVDSFLANVRRELLEAWDRGEEPLVCSLFARGGLQVGNSVWTPDPPGEPEMPQSMIETIPEGWTPEQQEKETTATEDDILRVLQTAEAPIKLATIAKRASRVCTNHFRQTVYDLVKRGKVTPMPDYKYWLADRPAPAINE